jgi:hypothetical protein
MIENSANQTRLIHDVSEASEIPAVLDHQRRGMVEQASAEEIGRAHV